MPYIQIDLSENISDQQAQDISAGAVHIMVSVLHKKPALTSVAINAGRVRDWSIGGGPAPSTGFIRAHITEGTNSAEEIEEAIGAFHGLLRDTLDHYEPVSYVVIDEVASGNWGFGGRSQAHRRRT
ncbi:MAG: tautomerase family protein [Gammaproteobacteria bacterium]